MEPPLESATTPTRREPDDVNELNKNELEIHQPVEEKMRPEYEEMRTESEEMRTLSEKTEEEEKMKKKKKKMRKKKKESNVPRILSETTLAANVGGEEEETNFEIMSRSAARDLNEEEEKVSEKKMKKKKKSIVPRILSETTQAAKVGDEEELKVKTSASEIPAYKKIDFYAFMESLRTPSQEEYERKKRDEMLKKIEMKKRKLKKANKKKSKAQPTAQVPDEEEKEKILKGPPSESDTATLSITYIEALRSKFQLRTMARSAFEDPNEEEKKLKKPSSESDTTTPIISYIEALRSDLRKTLRSDVNEEKKEEEEMMSLFSQAPLFRFELCKVFLSYNKNDECCKRQLFYSYNKDFRKRQLFGMIQAASISRDPGSELYGCFNIFNRKFDNPIVVTNLGYLSSHNISYCSLPVSTSVKITAQLYVTTDKVDDIDKTRDYDLESSDDDDDDDDGDSVNEFEEHSDSDFDDTFVTVNKITGGGMCDNYAFEICNESAFINLSDFFAQRPDGGSGCYISEGKDGYLELHYVALKYAVDAALELFVATSEGKKVAGRVMAYYGKNFDYGCSPAKKDLYNAVLFETKPRVYVKPGKINLMRSKLAVPAKFSLIIDANLRDFTSGDIILSGTHEFTVPREGCSSFGVILGGECYLHVKVDWKLPFVA